MYSTATHKKAQLYGHGLDDTIGLMQNDFLTQILGNPIRAKVLRFFILNDTEMFTRAETARRNGISERAAQKEIDALQKMSTLKKEKVRSEAHKGNQKRKKASKSEWAWSVDENFRFSRALSTFVHEISPMQFKAIEESLKGTGRLAVVILSGVFTGDLSRPTDILIVGDYMNENRLERAVKSFEPHVGREIRYAIFSTPEFRYRLTVHDKMVSDTLDYPHRVLLNRGNLL